MRAMSHPFATLEALAALRSLLSNVMAAQASARAAEGTTIASPDQHRGDRRCRRPRKARFRLAGWPLPGEGQTLRIATKGFRALSRRPPFQGLPCRKLGSGALGD